MTMWNTVYSDGRMTLFYILAAIKSELRFWTFFLNLRKILDLGYGGARRALYKLSPKSARILSAAITIDRWTGAWSYNLAPRRG